MAITKQPPTGPEWLDLRQAQAAFPLSRRVLWRWIREGRLATYRPFEGRKVLVKRSDIEAILEATRQPRPTDAAPRRRDASERSAMAKGKGPSALGRDNATPPRRRAAAPAQADAPTNESGSNDQEAIEALAFAHDAWARGSTLDPPENLTDATARNRWRFDAGAARAAYAALDTLGDAAPKSSDVVKVLLARAVIVGASKFSFAFPETAAALAWAEDVAAEAVRQVERDSIRRAETVFQAREREAATAGEAASGGDRNRFRIISDEQLEQFTPSEQLIEGLIAAESVNLYVGAPGSLKSFFALDQAACVQAGRPWANRRVKHGGCLYVLAEGARSFGLRTRAWKEHFGHNGPLGLSFLPQSVQFAERGEVAELLQAIERMPAPPVAIFVDTQARCAVGIEENSATAMGQLIAGVERVQRATKAAVTLLHHTPRSADRERGSSALRGAVDTILLLNADGDHLTITVDRQKEGEAGDILSFRKRVVDLGAGRSSCVLVPVSEQDQRHGPTGPGDLPRSVRTILEALRDTFTAGASSSQLLKATSLIDRTFYYALKQAKGWSLVDTNGKTHRITPVGRALFVGMP